MKKQLYLMVFILIALLAASCTIHDASTSPDLDHRKIYGSGDLVTEQRDLSEIHSVEMSTAGEVYVTYGSKQKISVTVDDNIQQYVTTNVYNGKLVIGVHSHNSINNMHLTVNITMTDIRELSTSSAGFIKGKNKFIADDIYLNISSAGNIYLDLEAENLRSTISSAGSMYLSGQVNTHRASIASAGNLCAFPLITNSTDITLSSAGNAEVYASESLDATLSSIGSLYYKGYPTIHSHISSLGRIYNAN